MKGQDRGKRQRGRIDGETSRRLIENIPAITYISSFDEERVFIYVSPHLEKMLGFSSEEWGSRPKLWQEKIHPDDRKRVLSAFSRCLEACAPFHADYRLISKSGSVVWVHDKALPYKDETGKNLCEGIMLDVTEQKLIQQTLAKTNETLQALVEASPLAIIVITTDATVNLWNSSAERLFNWKAEEVIGKPLPIVPEDRRSEFEEIIKRALRGELIAGLETVRQRRDGSPVEVSLSTNVMRNEGGEVIGVIGILEDITHRKKIERKLQQQIDQLNSLRDIDMAIGSSLDMKLTFSVVLDHATAHLGVDAACVLVLDPHSLFFKFAAGRGFRTHAIEKAYFRFGQGLAGRAAKERRLIFIPNLEEEGLVLTDALRNEGFKSYFAAPLVCKGQVKGVLEIYHRGPFTPDPDWLNFLDILAGQTAVALDNVVMFNELQRSNVELVLAYDTTIEGWSRALDYRDKETEGHSKRVTEMTIQIAIKMGMKEEELVHVRRGALLHDMGKLGVPDSILLKAGPLTEDEWKIMKNHPAIAFEILSPIQFLGPALAIPYCHHERWDGSGYPRGLKGEQIPLEARIFAVVDVWDALRSDRPYRPPWPEEKARDHIGNLSGVHFDPRVVAVFFE